MSAKASLGGLIRETAVKYPDDNPRKLATRLLKTLDTKELTALLANAIEDAQRNVVRGAEKSAFIDLFIRNGADVRIPNIASGEDVAAFLALFSKRFSIGNGEMVTWGDATIAHHEQRIAFLENMRGGITETIERHRNAITLISENGATCLNDACEASGQEIAA